MISCDLAEESTGDTMKVNRGVKKREIKLTHKPSNKWTCSVLIAANIKARVESERAQQRI